jgi:hypothetical protein
MKCKPIQCDVDGHHIEIDENGNMIVLQRDSQMSITMDAMGMLNLLSLISYSTGWFTYGLK